MNYGSVLGVTSGGAAVGVGAATVLPQVGGGMLGYWLTVVTVAALVVTAAVAIRRLKPIK